MAVGVQEAELIKVEQELENMMLSDEDYLERVSKDVVLPALTCTACNGFYRGPVRYCSKSHGVCSHCFPGLGKECPAGGCSEMYGEAPVTTGHQAELVKEYGLKVDCKYKRDGCDRKGIVQAIEDHEAECPDRLIACLMACGDFWQRAKDYEAHVGGHHQELTGHAGGWWFAQYFHPALGYRQGAHAMWVDPETGHSFSAVLKQEATFWSCFVMVYGGEKVAKGFSVQIKLSSQERTSSHAFTGKVCPMGDHATWPQEHTFRFLFDEFKSYNAGHYFIGEHNRDKSGELKLPITVKVEKKK